MTTQAQIVQTAQGWFVETPEGRIGPMESRQEATRYLTLMQLAKAAGSETACTDTECQ